MQINIFENADQSGYQAALESRDIINKAIAERGSARIVLSTGASQFEFLEHFITMDIEWDKVEMFHLDEYIALPESHPASFRKYLKERFLQHVNIGQAWLVDGEGDVSKVLAQLGEQITKAPVDLALIGIGENAHVAFNDPPADFDQAQPFKVVNLTDTCKAQQVGEGWFASLDDVPKQAITMSVKQIMACRHIISVVPRAAKATAIRNTFSNDVDVNIPATILKTHDHWSLYLDKLSASQVYAWS
ncbi:glucosamine-6-phosphate deaminase [Paenibacillus sp. MY03]|uniref:6-phosphogluconolactonase n=1 Tax=Paenibacillus sp. MY03 TaxID=302980 RepID=UPI000B3C1841|nr:6-phosphogluconolactonase [Paenibacillus sp. MY03]OUS74334.1 glucosamine-6-phosphate deaminase [Paenibacillus sp. MY03]